MAIRKGKQVVRKNWRTKA